MSIQMQLPNETVVPIPQSQPGGWAEQSQGASQALGFVQTHALQSLGLVTELLCLNFLNYYKEIKLSTWLYL